MKIFHDGTVFRNHKLKVYLKMFELKTQAVYQQYSLLYFIGLA